MTTFFATLLLGIIFEMIGAMFGINNIGIIVAIATVGGVIVSSLDEIINHLKALIRIQQ